MKQHTKETPMKQSEVLQRELARVLAEEQRLEDTYGAEPTTDDSVIAFRVRFNEGQRFYSYAALRSGGRWFTTGPNSPKSYTWTELVGWLDAKDKVTKIKVLRVGKGKQ